MNQRLAGIILLVAAAGCGNPYTPPPASEKQGDSSGAGAFPTDAGPFPAEGGAPAGNAQSMEGRGLDLRLYDTDPTTGVPRKVNLWIHADVWSVTEDQDIWSFQKARAVIYGQDEQAEAITLEAGEGRFQESKIAYLKGGVHARVSDMNLELTDLEWLNDEGVAQSGNALSIQKGDSFLKASGVRLYPSKKKLTLTNVSGELRLGRTGS